MGQAQRHGGGARVVVDFARLAKLARVRDEVAREAPAPKTSVRSLAERPYRHVDADGKAALSQNVTANRKRK